MLRDSVRKLMDKHATAGIHPALDREQAYPDELYDAWVEMGLLRMPFPEEYGGLGGSVIDLVDHRRGTGAQERRFLHGLWRAACSAA